MQKPLDKDECFSHLYIRRVVKLHFLTHFPFLYMYLPISSNVLPNISAENYTSTYFFQLFQLSKQYIKTISSMHLIYSDTV